MNPDVAQTESLIRRLISRIIYHPENLEIEYIEFRGAVYWNVTAHADDQAKLIGKQGAHIRALTFLVAEIGLANDSMFKLKLAEPEIGTRTESTPSNPKDYDATPAAELLKEVIESIFGDESVTIKTTGTGFNYDFEIVMRDTDDVPDLGTAYENDATEMTIIGSIGTLWRAWAKKDGVNFTISSKQ